MQLPHLLNNYGKDIKRFYKDWIGVQVQFVNVSLKNPTDYEEVFSLVDKELANILQEQNSTAYELNIHLSPGTPAMASVWVLLGKTKYRAKFYQTYKEKVIETKIPFDITLDVIPDLLHIADSHFEHLSGRSPQEITGFENIIGNSKAIRLAVGRAEKAALRDVSVLLTGESGTGKELFARAIHAASKRRDAPFVALNCAAIPKELLESELFGHVKGAFTGANKDYEGAFKRADGGILFLDEIGECDPSIQAKLLRAIQPMAGEHSCIREIQPVGAPKPVKVNVRILSATNRDLIQMIEHNEFREDLFYRFAVITINLPPLQDRKSDIPDIAASLLKIINNDFEKQEPGYNHKIFSASTNNFVKTYSWPGNVRELYNVLLQAAVMAGSDTLEPYDLEAAISNIPNKTQKQDSLSLAIGDGFSLDKHLEYVQKHYIKRALNEAHGVKAKAARLLGIKNYQTLDAQIKKLKITDF